MKGTSFLPGDHVDNDENVGDKQPQSRFPDRVWSGMLGLQSVLRSFGPECVKNSSFPQEHRASYLVARLLQDPLSFQASVQDLSGLATTQAPPRDEEAEEHERLRSANSPGRIYGHLPKYEDS